VPFGQRLGVRVIHIPVVVCTSSPSTTSSLEPTLAARQGTTTASDAQLCLVPGVPIGAGVNFACRRRVGCVNGVRSGYSGKGERTPMVRRRSDCSGRHARSRPARRSGGQQRAAVGPHTRISGDRVAEAVASASEAPGFLRRSGPDSRRGYRLSVRVFTPRLGSSAFSQRGYVTMFVGGTPQ
jgi:hypothetical protein